MGGLLTHNVAAKIRGLPWPAERMSDMQAVGAEAILDNVISLDPGPLASSGPPGGEWSASATTSPCCA